MLIAYAKTNTPIDAIVEYISSNEFSIQEVDITKSLPSTDFLAEKLTNYSLPFGKFNVICDEQPKLRDILNSIKYKKLTWDVLKSSLLHGGGAESWFLNELKEVKVKRIDPLKLISIKETEYDEPHTVIFWEWLNQKDTVTPENLQGLFFNRRVFIDNATDRYIYENGTLVETIHHNIGIPAVNVLSPFNGDPFFQKQIGIIKKYEDAYDFLNKEARSTVNILLLPNKADSIKKFDDLRVLENISLEEGKPELLVKSPEYEGMFRYLEKLEGRIEKETGVIDFSSQEKASQDASGEALKLRLLTLQDKAEMVFNELNSFLSNRHKIISRLGNFELKEEEVTINLQTNMPDNFLNMTTAYIQLLGMNLISKETALEELGFDPQKETERLQEEDNEMIGLLL